MKRTRFLDSSSNPSKTGAPPTAIDASAEESSWGLFTRRYRTTESVTHRGRSKDDDVDRNDHPVAVRGWKSSMERRGLPVTFFDTSAASLSAKNARVTSDDPLGPTSTTALTLDLQPNSRTVDARNTTSGQKRAVDVAVEFSRDKMIM
ncbi:MAG: hypothetical protein C4317_07495 [Acidimicrobiia bacterium]